MSLEDKKKLWTRIFGSIFLVGILCIVGYGLSIVLPTLLALATNMIYLGIECCVLAALFYVIVLDSKFRTTLASGYGLAMYKIAKQLIVLDPIAFLRMGVEKTANNKEKLDKQAGNVNGVLRRLQSDMTKNAETAKQDFSMAKAAEKMNDVDQKIVKMNNVARMEKSNKRLRDTYVTLEKQYRILIQFSKRSALLIEDMNNEVNCMEAEYNAINAASSAFEAAKSLMVGTPNERASKELAMSALADNYSSKMGEIENFMNVSSDMLKQLDLQSAVLNDRGMEIFAEWEKNGESQLLGNDKAVILSQAENPNDIIDLDADHSAVPVRSTPVSSKPGSKYNNMFDK